MNKDNQWAPPAQSKASHTPGPWRQSEDMPLFIHGPNGVLVARAHESQLMGRDEPAANAILIAAAPDLLDALEAILGDLQTVAPKRKCTIAMALAAVRAAGGSVQDASGASL